jgi:6-pyruvoyl-tetrahydropterin synthase
MTCLFVEQLTVIDCAYLDGARGLVGESWIVDVELRGDLDRQSMVLDFGEVKQRLKRIVDDSADHSLLVPLRHPQLELHRGGGRVGLHFRSAAGGAIEHQGPQSAVTLLDAGQVDAATVTAFLQPLLAAQVPSNVDEVRLALRNEAIDGAWYQYAHGLKKHAGHCQRIAHGHRSRLQVRAGGLRQPALESAWASRWRDIYLGTREDLVHAGGGRLRFEYRAADGDFALELPQSRCELLDDDSTVERIAEYIAVRNSIAGPAQEIEVRAYEGVMKGAVAHAHGGRLLRS